MYLRCGQLVIYEIVTSEPSLAPLSPPRTSTLLLQFVKVLSKSLELHSVDEMDKNSLNEHKRTNRSLIPFSTSPSPETTYKGVFVTGQRPLWILATDRSATKTYSCAHSVVHSFTACSLWELKSEFLMYTDEVRSLSYLLLYEAKIRNIRVHVY